MALTEPGRAAPGPDAAARGRTGARRRRVQWTGYLYVLPAFAVLTVFLLVPLGQLVQISFYHWDGLSGSTWAGLSNYTRILHDPVALAAFWHCLVLVFFYAVVPIALALFLTAVMTRGSRLRGVPVFRTLLFLPQVVATVVVATAWAAIYAPGGVLNDALSAVGLGAVARPWLGDFSTALPAVGLIGTWLEIGLCLVLFLAGTGRIPRERYEAAKVDGAGAVREFFAVTLPGLRGQITVAMTLTVIAALRTFDLVYVTTHAGPGNATAVPAIEVYDQAFDTGQVGYACAIAVVLTALILLLTYVINRLRPEEDDA